jgi:hypothetical protein
LHVRYGHALGLSPANTIVLGNLFDGQAPTLPADLVFKAFSEQGAFGKPGKSFAFHGFAPPAIDPAVLEFEPHTNASSGQISNAVNFAVVKTALDVSATGTSIFF